MWSSVGATLIMCMLVASSCGGDTVLGDAGNNTSGTVDNGETAAGAFEGGGLSQDGPGADAAATTSVAPTTNEQANEPTESTTTDQSSEPVSEASLDTAAAVAVSQAIIEGDKTEDGFAEGVSCRPGEASRRLAAIAADAIGTEHAAVEDFASSFATESGANTQTYCTFERNDEPLGISSYGVAHGPIHADLETFVADLAELDGVVPPIETTALPPALGGEVAWSCTTFDPAAEVDDFCELDWSDGVLVVSVYVYGAAAREIDPGPMAVAMVDLLPDFVDGIINE